MRANALWENRVVGPLLSHFVSGQLPYLEIGVKERPHVLRMLEGVVLAVLGDTYTTVNAHLLLGIEDGEGPT